MRYRILLLCIMATMFVCLIAHCAQAKPQAAGPVGVVNAFYRFHFAHGMGFEERTVRRKQRWLTAELYELLLAELRKPVAPDEVPYFDGDPFTDAQEYPNAFRVGRPAQTGARARVPVVLLWLDRGKVMKRRTLQVELRRAQAGWRIANFIYPDDRDLLRELKRTE